MNPKELMAFIQRIISTSPDQRAAQQALKQLMEILTASGESSGELMIKTALTGVTIWGVSDVTPNAWNEYTWKLNGTLSGILTEQGKIKTSFDAMYDALAE